MLSPIKDSLLSSFKTKAMKKQYIEQSVKYYWKDIVGDDVARHVSCGKFSRGTLTVHTDSSVWSHQVLMMKRTLIKKINEFADDKIVKDIRIQTGYQAKFREINKDLPNLDYYLDKVTLEEETVKDIKTKTSSVTDDRLRYKLASILEKQKKLDKYEQKKSIAEEKRQARLEARQRRRDETKIGLSPRTLCMDCTLDMSLCPKMRDIAKKKIEDYDFIIAGYQIQDVYDNIEENVSYKDYNEYELVQRLNALRIERFAVKECTLFKKSKKR